MKKKLLTLICAVTCIFTLTACGKTETVSEFEQAKYSAAEQRAQQIVQPLFTDYLCQGHPFVEYGIPAEDIGTLSMEEIEFIISDTFGLEAEGNAIVTGIDSFQSAIETIGGITSVGAAEIKVDGNEIIVNVEVTGSKKNATAEIVLSNDMFLKIKSASLNPKATIGELMGRAALNTLIGMGTVFVVLILISLIIACFGFIPKIQKNLAEKKAAKQAAAAPVASATEVPAAETVDETDDLELVAVIAAAIAASQGASSTDGFVVRSIRRRK